MHYYLHIIAVIQVLDKYMYFKWFRILDYHLEL